MKNYLMLTHLATGQKITLPLVNFAGVIPLGQNANAGSVVFGAFLPIGGIQVQDSPATINEQAAAWLDKYGTVGRTGVA